MAIIKMQKVSLLVYKNKIEEATRKMQEFGEFEPAPLKEGSLKDSVFAPYSSESSKAVLRLAELDFAIKMLSPYAPAKSTFREKVLGDKIETTEEEAYKVVKDFDYQSVVEKCNDIEDQVNKNKSELSKIQEDISALSVWQNLRFSLKFQRESDHSEMRIGSIATKDFKDLAHRISRISLADLEVVNENTQNTYFLVVFHKDITSEINSILETFRFAEMNFSQYERTCKEELVDLEDRKIQIESGLISLEDELKTMAQDIDKIKLAYDYYLWEQDKDKAQKSFYESEKVVLFEGFIPEARYNEFEKEIYKITKYAEITKIQPENEMEVPVELKNNSLFAPFESVTRIFGLPLSTEIDPTPYLAPFFAIFFGFCLTDAGYGIILSIASFLILRSFPLESAVKKMVSLMFMCGFTTFFMGVLFGGWFGMTPAEAPSFLVNAERTAFVGQIFDPINDLTDKIMPLAFLMGVFQLWFGVILKGFIKLKNGQKSEAFQTSFFLAFMIALLIVKVVLGNIGMKEVSAMMTSVLYAGLVLLIWGLGYGNKNPIARILFGILGLVDEAMGWLSNVLSYSRLFALGLATGIIAQVFNKVALTIGEMLPAVIGVFMVVFIILLGHVINIALNLLGAFIHSGRLQFVEFFGKFLDCGGRRFAPLSRNSKYIFKQN